MVKHAADHLERFHISFDGSEVTVSTNVRGVREFIVQTYGRMIVPQIESDAGNISVLIDGAGFRFTGIEQVYLEGSDCSPMLPYLKEAILFHFVKARTDLLWIHAAAVEKNGRAVLLSGVSGSGKSTLSTRLTQLNWKLMSDDVAPIRTQTNQVFSFLQTPSRRIDPGQRVTVEEVGALERETVQLPHASVGGMPVPIGAVVFPTFNPSVSTEITKLRPGDLGFEILRNCRNLSDHGAAAVAWAAEIAQAVAGYALTYSNPLHAVELLDSLL